MAGRRTTEMAPTNGPCRCGHLKSLHLPRWRDDASVANKCERCNDAAPCPGYVPMKTGRTKARSLSRSAGAEQQLPLSVAPPPPAKPRPVDRAPERAAKVAIARRATPSAVPGNVKLTMTFDIPRELAGQLAARAVREGVNLEAVIVALLREGMKE